MNILRYLTTLSPQNLSDYKKTYAHQMDKLRYLTTL